MQVQPTNIKIDMTPHEARILVTFIEFAGADDQYGAVSDKLKIPVGEIVQVMVTCEHGLRSILGDRV